MPQTQLIIHRKPIQTPILNFFKADVATARSETASASLVFVHCDICADNVAATAKTLAAQGWGIYEEFAFCPNHEAMS